jgi:hypothetical protein
MSSKELLAGVGFLFYAGGVNERELWRAVGQQLADIRLRNRYDSTLAFATDVHGAPAKNTIDKIERGDPGTLDTLEEYCKALGTNLVSVLRAVLDEAENGPTLSADSLWVARMYQEGPDEDLRAGMLGAAKAQSRLLAATPAASPGEQLEIRASTGGSRGRGRTVRHHR